MFTEIYQHSKMLKTEGVGDGYICLGDLVNYATWSNECVELALSLPNTTLIMGNHEEAFVKGFYPGVNPLVQDFFKITFPNFKEKRSIETFVSEAKLEVSICTHTINNSYIFQNTKVILDNNYIIGHSHHQFEYLNNNFTLYNSGSVVQNRKFINGINYLIYDSDYKFVIMKSLIKLNIKLL